MSKKNACKCCDTELTLKTWDIVFVKKVYATVEVKAFTEDEAIGKGLRENAPLPWDNYGMGPEVDSIGEVT